MNQQHVTSQTCWSSNSLLEVEQHVGIFARLVILQVGSPAQLILKLYNGVSTVCCRCCLPNITLNGATTVTGDVVPDHFQPVLGNREWCRALVVSHAVTILDQFRFGRVFNGLVHYVFRVGTCTVRLVYGEDVV